MAGNPGYVAVVGSLNADLTIRTDRLPQPGETVRGSALVIAPGGKGANQAVAASLLGARVLIYGAVGDDDHGRMLVASLRRSGVDTSAVRLSPEPTGTAIIEVDAAGENTIVISAGANGTVCDVDEFGPDIAVLCLCLEIPLETVALAARRGKAAGAQVLLNLSPYAEVPGALLGDVDVLLLNANEAASLIGHPIGDWSDVVPDLEGRGIRRAVVTLGAQGAVVIEDGAVTTVPTVEVEAVDTTGAGDAFTGALAARLAAGESLVNAARYAARAGAWAATGEGAQNSYATAVQLA